MEKAGIFTQDHDGFWVWDGDELYDRDGVVLAYVRADVLTVGQTRLLIEHTAGSMKFRVRATSSTGVFGTVFQTGVSVNKLAGRCEVREYTLPRRNVFRKEREIRLADGSVAATVRPMLSGAVKVFDGPAYDELPQLDAVFLSWTCVLIDAPLRNLRI